MQPDHRREKSFVPDVLPWLIAAGALVIYLFTLNHWVTLGSMSFVEAVAGMNWPQYSLAPLNFLITLPFRLLPATTLPFALNLFMAVCGALTLAQLARAVALLPHDRTQQQRERELSDFSLLTIRAAWLPPVLAAVVCALQFSFWESSVAATGEMIEALLFAYVVRSILEFRVDGRNFWLFRAALIFGGLMANDWLMTAFLPLFLLSLLWIRGISFFNLKFLLWMSILGLAGVLLFLLMPWLQSHTTSAPTTFWETLRFSLGGQKNNIVALLSEQRWIVFLPILLPMLVMGIRWAASFGDNSPLGIALAALVFHIVHGVFLVMSVWIAFDPFFSPRIFPLQFGLGIPSLHLYFLSALGAGYYSGYFLLIFGKKTRSESRDGFSAPLLNIILTSLVWLLAVTAVVGLLYKNFPQIRASGRDTLQTLATALVKNLPAHGAVLVSDDPQLSSLAAAELRRTGHSQNFIFLNSYWMRFPAYHRFLNARHGSAWPDELVRTNQPLAEIHPSMLVHLLADAARTHDVYYLHPTFGYYLEQFYPEAHGLVYQFKLYPTNVTATLAAPVPAAATIAENQTFWNNASTELFPHLGRATSARIESARRNKSPFAREPDFNSIWSRALCSRALNVWGVTLQRAEQLDAATSIFQSAVDVNPDNSAAKVNLAYNKHLLAHTNAPFQLARDLGEELAHYKNWNHIMIANGPIDEPQFDYELGLMFSQGALYRQGAQCFERVVRLQPDNFRSRIWLGQIYNLARMSEPALSLVRAVRKLSDPVVHEPQTQVELISIEAIAYFNKNEPEKAERILSTALSLMSRNDKLVDTALQLYLNFQRPASALPLLLNKLADYPDDPTTLINLSFVYLRLERYDLAIPPLDHLLALQPGNTTALLNRAIAHLQSGQLDAAQKDYEVLKIVSPDAFQIYYGLGEIAWRKKDTATAIANYEGYLKNVPASGGDEFKLVQSRLKELKGK